MATRKGKKNAINLLQEDHERVRKLFSELEDTEPAEPEHRRELLDELEREIKIHSMIEEEIFYPAFKVAAEDTEDVRLFYEAAEEHHVVDMILPEVRDADPATPVFDARAKVLRETVEHHVDEEENDMFPTARELMSEDQLQELGNQLGTRKDELMEQWGDGGREKGRRPHRPEREHEPAPVRSHRRGGQNR